MLFKQRFLDGIAKGEVSLAFRRWRRPSVKAGGRLRTAIGELAIQAVEEFAESDITETDAHRAGYATRARLLDALARGRAGTLYRIEFTLAGPDARIALREQPIATEAEAVAIAERLARLDARSAVGPWTLRMLRLIAEHPAVRAGELAVIGGFEKEWLKLNVRKLKELGLTESLHPGYRLSPRGQVYLKLVERVDS
ncbi:MAG: hypothetical protein JNM56_24225 [Planctomycetia bacterium]|nr:hypothetical protein [Planctomycetia bacterium]